MFGDVEPIIRFLQDEKKLFTLMKYVMTIPIAVILYYAFRGTLSLEAITTENIIQFFITGQFLIPLIFYTCAFIICYGLLSNILPIFTFLFMPLQKNFHYGFVKTIKKFESKNSRVHYKNRFMRRLLKNLIFDMRKREPNEFNFSKIEPMRKYHFQFTVLIIQFFISYLFFLSNTSIFVGLLDVIIKVGCIVMVILFLYQGCDYFLIKKYPRTYHFIQDKRTT